MNSANGIAALLLAAHVLSMLGFATFPALLPDLRDEWRLSNAEAGLIGSTFFAGYIATVAWWTAMTDRADARRVYLAGSLLCTAGCAGFALGAQGLASAMVFQFLAGAGIAGTYMPGLRLLSDRVGGPSQSRYIAFYTAFFGIGTALSFFLAGEIAPRFGWAWAFAVSALGSLFAGGLVVFGLDHRPRGEVQQRQSLLATIFPIAAWKKVLANRPAAGYAFGYMAHCLELFASRGWMVAFLVFAAGQNDSGETLPWSATAIAAVMNLLSVPASILGNEVALRIGRRRWIQIVMVTSALCGVLVGFSAPWHWAVMLGLLAIYSMLVMAESATLTAGLIAAAPLELRGAAMGLYSLLGFCGAMVGPALFGAALDLAGGGSTPAAWAVGYLAGGAGCLLAPLVVRMFGRSR